MNSDLADDLVERIRRDAGNKALSPVGVIGRVDALGPSDLEAVRRLLESEDGFNLQTGGGGDDDRDMLVKDAEPITEANRNAPLYRSENLSDEKSRETNTGDGDGAGESDTVDGESDTRIKTVISKSDTPTDAGDAVEKDTPGERGENPTPEDGFGDANPTFDGENPPTATPSGRTFYPETLRRREWWVDWVLALPTADDGTPEEDATPTKQPVAPYRRGDAAPVRWNFGLDDDDHPSTAFETVERWGDVRIGYDIHAPDRVLSDRIGLGILIPPQQDGRTITLLDWDDVRDPRTEEIHPVAKAALEAFDGYAEISQSGEGIHQLVYGEIPGGLKKFLRHVDDEPFVGDDRPMVEMYQSGRLCAMTGDHVEGTGEDVTDGQDLIDRLCWEFGTAGNNATDTPSDPFARTRDGDDTPDHDTVDAAIRKAREYDGAEPDEWDTPAEWSLEYAGVLRARTRSDELSGIANWELIGYAAGIGHRDELDKETVLNDLKEYPTPQYGYDDARARKEIRAVYRKAENGNYHPPTRERLVERGILPESVVEDTEPVAPIAFAKLDALSGHERKRYARKQGLEIPSTDEAREALRDTVFRELRAGNTTVIDAPTALGKSHTAATTPWLDYLDTTAEAPVIHLHATRDARDEAMKATRQSTATGEILKGRKEISPLAGGDHDPVEDPDTDAEEPDLVVTIDGRPASEWFDLMCDEKGLPFSTALAIAQERNDQNLDELPPIGEEDPAVAQWDGLPRDDDGDPAVDVIHATHLFGHVPSLRAHTNVILDEQPDFTVQFTDAGTPDADTGRVRSMVNAYLQEIDAPVTTWEGFVSLARYEYDGHRSDAANERDALDDAVGRDPPQEWYANDPDAHALAPDLAKAIWNALRYEDPDAVGRRNAKVFHEPPRLDADDGEQYAGTWLSVVIDDQNTVRTVRSTPDFSQARAVIGLDAHPSMPMWELNGAPGMTRDAVLDPVERRLWRRYERGLTTVQIGEATRPRSGGNAREWMNDERVRTVLQRLRDHYGDGFDTLATTAQVEPAVREILGDVIGEDLDDDHTLHFGEEKSLNPEAFVDAIAGYVYGCMDPGDGMILDALAELNLDAEPGTVETEDGEIKREKGRTFEGPDADTAAALLASVRENHVAQAAGRYARNPDDPESSAVVYLHTDAAPEGFVDLRVPGVEWLASDLQREIIDELAKRPEATTRQIADAVDCDKEHVRKTLQRLEGEDLVDRDERTGEHGADVYQDAGSEDAIVDLGDTTNGALKDFSRWSLAVSRRHCDAGESDPVDGEVNGGDNRSAIATGGSDPPDRGD